VLRRWRRWFERGAVPVALVALMAGTGCDLKEVGQHPGSVKAFQCKETVYHARQSTTTFVAQTPHTDGDCDTWQSRLNYYVLGSGNRWSSWSTDPYGYTYRSTTSSPASGHWVCDFGVCAYGEN
jgi:hypothetical protein